MVIKAFVPVGFVVVVAFAALVAMEIAMTVGDATWV